jgi:Matrixin
VKAAFFYGMIASFLFILSAASMLPRQPNDYIFLPIRYAEASSHHHNNHTSPTSGHANNNSNIKHFHPPAHSILVCCAWNSQITNGELTYKTIGGNTAERQALNAAADTWMKSVKGLKLTQVSGKKSTADIIFGFQNSAASGSSTIGGKSSFGDTVGQTTTYFDGSGYVDRAFVNIATSAFGNSFTTAQLKQIVMHEIGHTLGLGHANFNGDLMSPVINHESGGISKCDISGVFEANQWNLAGSGTPVTPSHPQQDRVNC